MIDNFKNVILVLFTTFITGNIMIKSVKSYALMYKRQIYYIEYIRSVGLVIVLLVLITSTHINSNILKSIGFILYAIITSLLLILDAKLSKKLEVILRKFRRITFQNIILVGVTIPYSILLFLLYDNFNNITVEEKARYTGYFILGTLYFIWVIYYAINILEKFYLKKRIIKIIYKDESDLSDNFDDIFENKGEYILVRTKEKKASNSTVYETVIISKQEVKKVCIINETETL